MGEGGGWVGVVCEAWGWGIMFFGGGVGQGEGGGGNMAGVLCWTVCLLVPVELEGGRYRFGGRGRGRGRGCVCVVVVVVDGLGVVMWGVGRGSFNGCGGIWVSCWIVLQGGVLCVSWV